MKNKKTVYKWMDAICLIAGTLLLAISTKLLFAPAGFVIGGVSGIAIIVKSLTESIFKEGFPIWASNLILNIPLFVIAIQKMGWKLIWKTIIASFLFSFWLGIIPEITLFPADDYFLIAVFGGILSGLGIGIVLLTQSTTGGTDMAAVLLNRRIKVYSVAQIMQVLDGMIVLAGAAIFGISLSMYAIIAVYLMGKVSDRITEGGRSAKAAYIISEHTAQIANHIMNKLERGVTLIQGEGMYSGKRRDILICVVSKKELVAVKETVKEIDENAFIVIYEVKEVFGEGFVKYGQ